MASLPSLEARELVLGARELRELVAGGTTPTASLGVMPPAPAAPVLPAFGVVPEPLAAPVLPAFGVVPLGVMLVVFASARVHVNGARALENTAGTALLEAVGMSNGAEDPTNGAEDPTALGEAVGTDLQEAVGTSNGAVFSASAVSGGSGSFPEEAARQAAGGGGPRGGSMVPGTVSGSVAPAASSFARAFEEKRLYKAAAGAFLGTTAPEGAFLGTPGTTPSQIDLPSFWLGRSIWEGVGSLLGTSTFQFVPEEAVPPFFGIASSPEEAGGEEAGGPAGGGGPRTPDSPAGTVLPTSSGKYTKNGLCMIMMSTGQLHPHLYCKYTGVFRTDCSAICEAPCCVNTTRGFDCRAVRPPRKKAVRPPRQM